MHTLLDNGALLRLSLFFVHAHSQVPQVVCLLSVYRWLHLPAFGFAVARSPGPVFFPQIRFSRLLRCLGIVHALQRVRLALVAGAYLLHRCQSCPKVGHYSVVVNYSEMSVAIALSLLLSRRAV